ncbi:hypothetical protein FNV43_RR00429 [Rhamnella rubrinervis]|uniref:Ubiquitin-like protease family profile domain-containing protein n=1 Tax=Rhamnella rubrinervis TaxID=2594499 RepID=A0A8K0HN10_9ROSA|nr:hypothetical protein FNV43_RR00429 [Rhamnella rubrinervis]
MNEDVMEFNFNGNGAIFTRKEFGIITGLKMENTLDVPSPPYSDRIRNRYFGHFHKIKNMDVRNVFINLYVIGRLTPLNADEESVYKLNEHLLIVPLQKKRARMDVDMEREEYAYFYQQNTFNLGGPSIENVGEPSHSSHNHDELISYMEALNIKVDNVANDLYDFRLDSMRKIDGVANDLGNYRLESMREFQSIHNTMREMFDYLKHDYHPTKHATHNDHVNEDAIVHKNLETCDVVTTTETQLNLTCSLLPSADFNPKTAPPDELEMKLLTYMTSSDDVTLDYNVCDINKQFFREMIEGEWLNDKVLMSLNIEDRHWVLANINLVKRQIYLYDSTLSKSTYRNQFKPLWIMLPYILKQANFFAERSNIKSTMIQFSHSYVENFPKQGSR